jgi:thioesterase domain-containing protein
LLGNFLANLPHWFSDDFMKTGPKEMLNQFRRKLRAVRQGRSAIFSLNTTTSQAFALEDLFDIKGGSSSYRDMMEANLRALRTYKPKPYPGRITLLRARARPLFNPEDPDLGWGSWVTGGVVIREVPGNHNSILEEPLVAGLAKELKAVLAQTDIDSGLPCPTTGECASAGGLNGTARSRPEKVVHAVV